MHTNRSLGTIGAGQTLGARVNNRQQVGAFHLSEREKMFGALDTGGRAVLWQNGVLLDVNRLMPPQQSDNGWEFLERARDVTDRGLIGGSGSFQDSQKVFILRPPTLLQVENPALSQDNVFSFTVVGQSGLQCQVEAAVDLAAPSWVSLGTVTLQNGTATFTDAGSPNYPTRFYRVSSGSHTSGDVVGFLIKPVPANYSMVANPFESADNRVPALFESAPVATIVYRWNEATQGYRINSKDDLGGEIFWNDRLMTLSPGEGAIVLAPSAFTVKWTGRVRQNSLNNVASASWAIHSSIAALSGLVDTALTFPIAHGDTISRMTGTDGTYTTYTYSGGAWSPSQPSIGLGEAFWSTKAKRAVWRQNFSAW